MLEDAEKAKRKSKWIVAKNSWSTPFGWQTNILNWVECVTTTTTATTTTTMTMTTTTATFRFGNIMMAYLCNCTNVYAVCVCLCECMWWARALWIYVTFCVSNATLYTTVSNSSRSVLDPAISATGNGCSCAIWIIFHSVWKPDAHTINSYRKQMRFVEPHWLRVARRTARRKRNWWAFRLDNNIIFRMLVNGWCWWWWCWCQFWLVR